MKLTRKTLIFIALRFGKGATLKETGKALNMNREAVRLLESKILREVKKNSSDK